MFSFSSKHFISATTISGTNTKTLVYHLTGQRSLPWLWWRWWARSSCTINRHCHNNHHYHRNCNRKLNFHRNHFQNGHQILNLNHLHHHAIFHKTSFITNHNCFAVRKFTTFHERSINEITVRTCVGTYDKLRKIKPNLYRNGPSEGIDITVKYFDSWKPVDGPYEQVVVAVHGSAGSYTNFYPIPEYFAEKNIRFIAPNLPDFSHTRENKVFWHSSEEKCQFLKDFLKKLGVQHIDCLVAHSIGIATVSALWDDPDDISINSIALFSPQPLFDQRSRIKFFLGKLLLTFRNNWWYDLLGALFVHKMGLIPMRFNTIDDFLGVCATGFDRRSFNDLPERIEHLTKSFIPVVILYGSREKLVAKFSIRRLRKLFEIEDSDIIYIDPTYDQPDWIRLDRKITYYHIKNGGHLVHANYWKFSSRMIENLLNYKY